MNSDYFVVDSFVWIEYFRGSKRGQKLEEIIKECRGITPTVVLAELSDVYHRENNADWKKHLAFITTKTTIVDLTANIAIKAGEIKKEARERQKTHFGLADAILLATALAFDAAVLTGDKHFRGLPNVEFVGE